MCPSRYGGNHAVCLGKRCHIFRGVPWPGDSIEAAMSDKMMIFVWDFLVPLVMIPVGVPMMLRKIKPNVIYGFRTRKTLSDQTVWYEANAYAGKAMVIAGMVSLVGLLVLYLLRDSFGIWMFNILGWVAVLVPLAWMTIASFVHLSKL
ncbi:hypothetical protein GF402_05800 [Candidatus Fermentibacteria bacterium]|nr:hypothetical protein [Candidatus Fermentibacteria bacterium]